MNTTTILTIALSSVLTIVISTLSFFFKRLLDEQKQKEIENSNKNLEQDRKITEQEKKINELDKQLTSSNTICNGLKNELNIYKEREEFVKQANSLKITEIEKKLELNSQADYLREKAEKEKLVLELEYIKKDYKEANNRFSRIEDRYNRLLEMSQNSRNREYTNKQ